MNLIARKLFFCVFLVLNALIVSPFFLVGFPLIDWLDAHPSVRILAWLPRVFLFVLGGCALYVSYLTVNYVVYEQRLFWDAFKSTWANVRYTLVWLPGIGHWFERPLYPREELEDDDLNQP